VEAAAFVASAPTGQHLDLGAGVSLYAGRSHAEIMRGRPAVDPTEHTLFIPGSVKAFGLHFEARLLDALPGQPLDQYCGPLRQVFDADALGPAPVLRHRRDGDRFAPLGLGGSKKLQDYFVDAGVPAPARDAVPLVVTGDTLAWIVGHATSATTAVRKDTVAWAEITVRPCD
jgi:tRNA(Ile)-lysidine synthetase-like protein